MKVILCFRRDDDGHIRLFHAYDEHEAIEANGGTPQGLMDALDSTSFRPGEHWGIVQVDTDDPILRGKEVQGFTGPVCPLGPIDFDTLIQPDRTHWTGCSAEGYPCTREECEADGCLNER